MYQTYVVEVGSALDYRDSFDKLFHNDVVMTTKHKIHSLNLLWKLNVCTISHMSQSYNNMTFKWLSQIYWCTVGKYLPLLEIKDAIVLIIQDSVPVWTSNTHNSYFDTIDLLNKVGKTVSQLFSCGEVSDITQ